ncbi:1-phosphofructokinase family hexose kinase [Sphaerisporangium krabiense]|uniref:Tagatose 6-phosphate kinase n=1 Tax=Sphaerisporangium krabiense TaxID=763782 RepID=A0A7W8Z0F4_9ACTN|nr:PfkB family carbohydrate kinase [Sphaerisporangium krabiense]MBB5624870.1 tagatose 6-phosphate kinase [Sphaerisporangium krabiense]
MTLNAALDVTYMVDGVDWDGVNRVRAVHRRAGGKGVNVARVLRTLGEDVVVAGLGGGLTGAAIETDLSAAGLPSALTRIAAESRTTVTITTSPQPPRPEPVPPSPTPGEVHGSRETPDPTARTALPSEPGRTALFNEPGPEVTPEELGRFMATFQDLAARADAVVLSGSLPRGVPLDLYATLAGHARDLGVPVIVDCDGAPLRLAPAGRPSILKPNAGELAHALSPGAPATGDGVAEALAGAEALRRAGGEAVVVSMGRDGLVAVTGEGTWRARMPYAVPGNPTGAGDALVAGLARGLVRGTPWPERLRTAAALGAASAATPVAGEVDLRVYRAVRDEIGVEPCPS